MTGGRPEPGIEGSGPTGGIEGAGPTGAPTGEALAAALDYVAAWRGRTVVIKVGGSILDEAPAGGEDRTGTLPRDLALLHGAGVRTVVVHGGGPEVTRMQERLGQPSTFVDGLRVTDEAAMEVVEMVLSGRVNKRVVARLAGAGARALGLSGRDGSLLRARPHPAAERLGRVGEVERVDPAPVEALLGAGFLPVVSSIGTGPDGGPWNLNADAAAAALATALGAQKLILLTDVPGVFEERDGERVLCSELDPAAARRLAATGVVSRGMVPKVDACLDALEGGVGSAHIVGSETPHGLLLELFTEEGIGTMIRSGEIAFRRRRAAGGAG